MKFHDCEKMVGEGRQVATLENLKDLRTDQDVAHQVDKEGGLQD